MTTSAVVMRQHRVVVARLAMLVHTARVTVAGRLGLVPHAMALVTVRRPMLTARAADVRQFGQQATDHLRQRELAA